MNVVSRLICVFEGIFHIHKTIWGNSCEVVVLGLTVVSRTPLVKQIFNQQVGVLFIISNKGDLLTWLWSNQILFSDITI